MSFKDESKYKKIKDPIYGYIDIPSEIVKNIVDTPPFQRLRRILQTSYTPLYPSALGRTYNYLTKNVNSDLWTINDETINILKKDIEELEKNNQSIADRKTILKVMTTLQSFARRKSLDCDFVILENSQFISGFEKTDFNDIKIVLNNTGGKLTKSNLFRFTDIVSSFNMKPQQKEKFYYIFYNRPVAGKSSESGFIKASDIIRELFHIFDE